MDSGDMDRVLAEGDSMFLKEFEERSISDICTHFARYLYSTKQC